MNTPNNFESAVRQLRMRIQNLLFVKYLSQGLVGALFAWGTFVIACRAAGGVSLGAMLGVGGGLALAAVIVAAVLIRKKTPDRKNLIAAIDCESNSGGILMSQLELGSADVWLTQLREMKTPHFRWQAKKTLIFVMTGLIFVAFSLLLPDRTVNALAGTRKLDVSNQVQELNNKLEKLQEEKILDPEKVEALKEEIKKIQQNAEAEGPIKTWEAIDHLNDKLTKEAQKAAEELLKEQEKLQTAEAMAEALKEQLAAEENTQGPSSEEMQDLANAMQNMLSETAGDDEMLNDIKKQIEEQGLESLTQEQLEQMAQKFSDQCKSCENQLNNLKNARMIDPDKLKNSAQCDSPNSQSLKDFLDSQCKGACEGDGECNGDGQNPGRGGISRGPGSAPVNYDHNTTESGAEMTERALEPDYVDMESSIKMGVSRNAPTPNHKGSAAEEGGAVTDTTGVAGSSGRDVVLPKHRGAVKRFFDTGN